MTADNTGIATIGFLDSTNTYKVFKGDGNTNLNRNYIKNMKIRFE